MIQLHLPLNFRKTHSELLSFLLNDKRNVDRSFSNAEHILNLAYTRSRCVHSEVPVHSDISHPMTENRKKKKTLLRDSSL